ncbi:MAG: choice-of-anchor L domain-containing protein, partial [Bacteroidales bacterium]|nr:choice-of-anchor L domain-containing protein [Bacteroidales bacterium]
MKKHIILTLSLLTVVLLFSVTVLGQDISKASQYPGRKYPPTQEVKSKSIGVKGSDIKASAGSISVAENPTYNLMTPEQLVRNVLVTGCLQTSNIKYGYYKKNTNNTWSWVDHVWSAIPGDRQMGYFEKGTSNFPIEKGLILATGKISSAMGPNTIGNKSDKMVSAANDPDLSKITAKTMYDASSLEFDFVPAGNTLEFKYIFTSEEYIEYCETEFNDAFGFFLSGPGISGTFSNNAVNLATIPGGIPVSINTIHPAGTNINNVVFPAENETYYISNPSGSLTMQYDGGTVTLTATYNVTACSTYHIKLSVADASDQQWDGAVFLQAKSFNSEPVTITNINPDYSSTDFSNIFEGCKPMHLTFERGTTELGEPLDIQLQYSGTAVNGVDVLTSNGDPLPSEITIPIGQTKYTIDYYAVADGVGEGSEILEIQTLQSCPCDPNAVYILKEIRINETPVSVTAQANNILCNGTSAGVITVSASVGSGNYLYSLNGGAWQNSNLFSGLSQGTYNVSVKDIGSCAVPAFLGNIVLGAPAVIQANAGADVSICSGTTTQLNGSGGVIYSWSPRIGLSNYSIPNPIASPISTTTYTLTVTDANNICTSTDQVVVSVIPSPTILITPPSSEICAGSNLTLTASGGSSYLWNPSGATTSEIIVSPYSNSSYSVIGTSLNGCKGIASVDVVVKPIPQNVNAGNDASIALCETYLLQGSATGSSGSNLAYQWSPTTGLSNPNIANPVFTPSSSGIVTFTLTVTDINSCSVSDQVIINIASALNTTISGQNNISCYGTSTGSATVSANGGTLPYSYSWNTSPVQVTSTATGLSAGSYTVTVTDAKNCISTSQAVISQPLSDISFGNPIINNTNCTGSNDGKIVVNATGGTGLITYSIDPNIGVQSPTGTFTNLIAQSYTITATDGNGCIKSAIGNVGTTTDVTLPLISCPANVTATTNTGCTATGVALGTPVTADNCGVALVTNNAPAAFPLGATTVTWTVTDNSGNKATCDQTVTVSDNILPTIICPAPITISANIGFPYATGINLGTPVTSDNCGVASVTNNAPAQFPVGLTSVTWTVTDVNGLLASCTQMVIVTDTQSPVMNCPANVIVNCIDEVPAAYASLAEYISADGTVTDNDGIHAASFTLADQSSNGMTCPEIITRIYTVADINNNFGTCSQQIIVHDKIAPVIDALPAETTVNCPAAPEFAVASATDNCGSDFTLTFEDVTTPGACAGSYSVTRTWTATDACGNTSEALQKINVQDVTAPVIAALPAETTVNCPTAPEFAVASATDNCGSDF